MNNEIVEVKPQALAPAALNEQQLKEFLDISGVGRGLPEDKRKQFINIAQAYGLNPFKREIYCISYGGQTSIITGYEVYLKRAERTGKLDGWHVGIDGTGENMKAQITIYRKDFAHPFKHEVYFNEAANRNKDGKLNSVWAKMPQFMLKKVAIAQGFRLCFSDELGGMPYTQDELPQDEKKEPSPVITAEPVEMITNEQLAQMQELGINLEAMAKFYGVNSAAEMTRAQADKAIAAKAAKMAKEAQNA